MKYVFELPPEHTPQNPELEVRTKSGTLLFKKAATNAYNHILEFTFTYLEITLLKHLVKAYTYYIVEGSHILKSGTLKVVKRNHECIPAQHKFK